VTDDLSIRLAEIPKFKTIPKCSYCGKGNFWNEIWPAALALSKYLAKVFPLERLNGHRALVIGCGVGLEGLVLAKLGAKVSFLDHIPNALQLVSQNCLLNEIESFQTIHCCWQDLKNIQNIGKYDLVIGSDILYYPDEWPWIKSLFENTLKVKGMALFSEPIRSDSMNFFRVLAKDGFKVKWADPRWGYRDQRNLIYCVELYERVKLECIMKFAPAPDMHTIKL
jgi:2-polyprenyl-3-methyl-5-hydroxy-6-metoxy-1,4-benzoquinol methylase